MKRRAATALVVLVILAAFAVWLEPTRVVWGWLRGEAFYRGRPTSYWSQEVAAWQYYPLGMAWVRQPTKMEQWIARLRGRTVGPAIMPAPFEDPRAMPVLRELLVDGTPNVRRNAEMDLSLAPFQRNDP